VTEPLGERPEAALRAKQARAGGDGRYHAKAHEQGKLFARERLRKALAGVAAGGRSDRCGPQDLGEVEADASPSWA
jgi:hypothetical protein